MDNDKEIVLRLEHILAGNLGTGLPTSGIGSQVSLPSQETSRQSAFTGGISAQLFVSGLSQLLNATGNQEVGSAISKGAEYTFLLARASSGDITAIATMFFKTSAEILKKVQEYREEQKQIAQSYNDLTILQLKSGQVIVTANSVTSYDKWGKMTIKDRK